MQLSKGLFIATVLCVASVGAGNSNPQQDETSVTNGPPVTEGFDVHQVRFKSDDPKEEVGEEKGSLNTVLIVSAVGACACIGVLGAMYMKRRKNDDKLPGDIFTIDDKNSVL